MGNDHWGTRVGVLGPRTSSRAGLPATSATTSRRTRRADRAGTAGPEGRPAFGDGAGGIGVVDEEVRHADADMGEHPAAFAADPSRPEGLTELRQGTGAVR